MIFFKKIKIAKIEKKSGFTLIESLVAISIFTLSVVALISILATSIQDLNFAKRKIIATYLAQEGLELVRNLRDTYVLDGVGGWTNFRSAVNSCTQTNGCIFNYGESGNITTSAMISLCQTSTCNQMLYNPTTGKYNYVSGDPSGYFRKINLTHISSSETRMTTTVYWNQASGQKNVSVSDVLFNWWEQ